MKPSFPSTSVLGYLFSVPHGTAVYTKRLTRILSTALLILCLLPTSCRSSGITVQIVNQTPSAIRSIEVIYPGGSYGIANLARGNSHAKWIKPTADAALRINYLDAAGQKHQLETATIRQGYAGGLAVVLLPQDQVKVEDHTRAAGQGH